MRTLVLSVLALTLLASAARSTPITFRAAGVVTSSDARLLGAPIEVGTALSWVYTFDSEAADIRSQPDLGDYLANPTSNLLRIGRELIDFGTGSLYFIAVWLDDVTLEGFPHSASYRVGTQVFEPAVHVATGTTFYMDGNVELFDTTQQAFLDDSLPLIPPWLGRFDVRRIVLDFWDDEGFSSLEASLTSLRLVPEPPTGLVFFVGLALASRMRR